MNLCICFSRSFLSRTFYLFLFVLLWMNLIFQMLYDLKLELLYTFLFLDVIIDAETSDLNPRVMCTSKSESDESAILECVDIKIILENLPSKLLISIGYCQTN